MAQFRVQIRIHQQMLHLIHLRMKTQGKQNQNVRQYGFSFSTAYRRSFTTAFWL
uniref:Uncharacterized protein n=1 Tax=Arundo donax TaxID=35708 RepID=A0A0A9DQH2_ARUDO